MDLDRAEAAYRKRAAELDRSKNPMRCELCSFFMIRPDGIHGGSGHILERYSCHAQVFSDGFAPVHPDDWCPKWTDAAIGIAGDK